jgi:predicted nucleic acid-binding protein
LSDGSPSFPKVTSELPSNVKIQEKDQPILQAAIASKASHLITGDRRDFGRYFGKQVAGIWVMPPRQYLDTKKT